MSALVSVIIPTYNREKFLPYALKSVKNQTYKNWELIIVDDGSKDKTEEICRLFAKSVDQPVRYIYQENQGVASARNTGLNAAHGDYIAFLDSDDRWYPWHLKKCIFYIEKYTVDLVSTSERKFDFLKHRIISNHNFYKNNNIKHPIFEKINLIKVENLTYKYEKPTGRGLITYLGYPSGLQCSLFKAKILKNFYFPEDLYVGEDRFLIYKLILQKSSFILSYSITVARYYHNNHLSAISNPSPERRKKIANSLLKCYKRLLSFCSYYDKYFLYKIICSIYKNHLFPISKKEFISAVLPYYKYLLLSNIYRIVKR